MRTNMHVKTQNWQDRLSMQFEGDIHPDTYELLKSFITYLLEERDKEKDEEWRDRIEKAIDFNLEHMLDLNTPQKELSNLLEEKK